MKTRKHFIRKYELLARCIQTNLELFILQYSGKPVNAEPTTCSISIIVVCGTIIVSTI